MTTRLELLEHFQRPSLNRARPTWSFDDAKNDENRAIDGRYFIRIIISRHVATRVGVHVAVDERCVGDADDEEGDAAEEPAATRCALFE